jgi:hypothetical protein
MIVKRPNFLSYIDQLIDGQRGRQGYEIWLTSDQLREYAQYQAHCQRSRINTETVKPLRYRGFPLRSSTKRFRSAGVSA